MDFEKSMKYTNKKRTLCEVIREANDIIEDWDKDYIVTAPVAMNQIKNRLKEIHTMAKKMTKKLYKYSKKWDKDFWAENKDYEEDLLRRMNE